jgi:hypothetical protein
MQATAIGIDPDRARQLGEAMVRTFPAWLSAIPAQVDGLVRLRDYAFSDLGHEQGDFEPWHNPIKRIVQKHQLTWFDIDRVEGGRGPWIRIVICRLMDTAIQFDAVNRDDNAPQNRTWDRGSSTSQFAHLHGPLQN